MEKENYLEKIDEIKNQIEDCRKFLDTTVKNMGTQINLLENKLDLLKQEYNEQYKNDDLQLNNNIFKIENSKQNENITKNTFKIVNSFNPVEKWIESFKKSEKWNKTIKWLLPNVLNGIAQQEFEKTKEAS